MTTFELTEKHIKLLRNAYVSWDNSETGAPSIDSKRPYGNSYVPGDIHEILTGKNDSLYDLPDDERYELEREYYELHRETETALQIVLDTGKFEAGEYQSGMFGRNWRKIP